jgi:hypothetical protein
MTPFDSYEISPCVRLNDEGQPDPNGNTFEVCEPHEAHCWTLYGHIPGEGVLAIGDFATREGAEEVFQRITGIPFAETGVVQARLRVMHAGATMLDALQNVWEYGMFGGDLVTIVRRAIAEATGGQPVPNPLASLLLASLRSVLPYAEAELASLQEAQKRDGGLEAEVAACDAAIDQASQLAAQIEAGAA